MWSKKSSNFGKRPARTTFWPPQEIWDSGGAYSQDVPHLARVDDVGKIYFQDFKPPVRFINLHLYTGNFAGQACVARSAFSEKNASKTHLPAIRRRTCPKECVSLSPWHCHDLFWRSHVLRRAERHRRTRAPPHCAGAWGPLFSD